MESARGMELEEAAAQLTDSRTTLSSRDVKANDPGEAGNQTLFRLFTDGAARGNPGPAGIGAVIFRAGEAEPVKEVSHYIGETTNNVAEYRAMLAGLEELHLLGARRIEIFSDSQLLVRQVQGVYETRDAKLIPLLQQVRQSLRRFRNYAIMHIDRSENRRADRLAGQAVDAARGISKRKQAGRSQGATDGRKAGGVS